MINTQNYLEDIDTDTPKGKTLKDSFLNLIYENYKLINKKNNYQNNRNKNKKK